VLLLMNLRIWKWCKQWNKHSSSTKSFQACPKYRKKATKDGHFASVLITWSIWTIRLTREAHSAYLKDDYLRCVVLTPIYVIQIVLQPTSKNFENQRCTYVCLDCLGQMEWGIPVFWSQVVRYSLIICSWNCFGL